MKKILIIDDDPEIVNLTKSRLEANHYQVVTASNGEEGARLTAKENPDLIIVDIKMPKADGYTFVRSLKKDETHKKIPVIVLTAYGAMKDMFEIEGVDGYMVKPFKADELLDKVSGCLRGNLNR